MNFTNDDADCCLCFVTERFNRHCKPFHFLNFNWHFNCFKDWNSNSHQPYSISKANNQHFEAVHNVWKNFSASAGTIFSF